MAMPTRVVHDLARLLGMWRCPCRNCTPDIREVYDILDSQKSDLAASANAELVNLAHHAKEQA